MEKRAIHFPVEHDAVAEALGDIERRVERHSPADDYAIHYYTTSMRDARSGEQRLVRSYRLLDLARNTQTPECWGAFELHKQADIVVGLLRFANYRVERMVNGWVATCPSCQSVTRGKIWEMPPKSCRSTPRCKGNPSSDVVETVMQSSGVTTSA